MVWYYDYQLSIKGANRFKRENRVVGPGVYRRCCSVSSGCSGSLPAFDFIRLAAKSENEKAEIATAAA